MNGRCQRTPPQGPPGNDWKVTLLWLAVLFACAVKNVFAG